MNEDKQSKIIPFPNLKKRLVDKGMEALKEKQFQDALEFFSEARNMDEDQADIQLGIALCLMEMGELQEASQVCKKMLHEDIGNYFTVLQVYLTILIQLREYDEVRTTIEAVLQENQMPAESAEQFYRLLDFSRRMSGSEQSENLQEEPFSYEPDDWTESEGFMADPSRQIDYIQSIRDRNVAKHMPTLKSLLEHTHVHPVIKTMILQVLMEHEVEKTVTVEKFEETLSVVPASLSDLSDTPFAKRVLNLLDDTLGAENPSLFEAVKELWIRHLFVLFPFLPKPADASLWAAALHKAGYEMHGIEIEEDELHHLYNVSSFELSDAGSKIVQVERMSYLEHDGI
ncbi:tetratricopeptide repeat protein [Bacillus sp. FJAT-42376]|uniref:tetratricopeptide repeat protein n=1 Tax=Bacillus sp. FJAT-42376 TaxID=2014076 RepID=UPI000F4E0DF2|nr:tetratricopeptide repeat protein [Bacillus sp. FJAT-42376]AZB43838.1 tetratricopeptide repeat protein [Bacillus sp. FJAT-42376]